MAPPSSVYNEKDGVYNNKKETRVSALLGQTCALERTPSALVHTRASSLLQYNCARALMSMLKRRCARV